MYSREAELCLQPGGKRQLCSAVPHVTRGQARVTRGQAQDVAEAGNGDTDSGGKSLNEDLLFGKFEQLLGEVSVEEIFKLVKSC